MSLVLLHSLVSLDPESPREGAFSVSLFPHLIHIGTHSQKATWRLALHPFGRMRHPLLADQVFETPTKEMRAVLPSSVPFKSMINNSLQGGALVASILRGDVQNLGRALDSDVIIEPTRGPLIPGFMAVKDAAKAAGAFGCTISGAGPTICAVVPNPDTGAKVGEAMASAFREAGRLEINRIQVVKLCKEGTKLL